MSYAYLFKYIIIGDTGEWFCLKLCTSSDNIVLFLSFLFLFAKHWRWYFGCLLFISHPGIVLYKNFESAIAPIGHISENSLHWQTAMLIDFLILYLFCRSGKVMFAATIHRQKVPTCTRSNNWCGVWSSNDNDWWEADQASNMGYSWTGGLSFDHTFVL